MQHLQPNSTLQSGKYKIEKVLGQGGFGITYLAEQVMLGRKVAVKEFFMKDLCNRDGVTSQVSVGSTGSIEMVERFKEKFLKEARLIACMDNSHIVRIYDIFEENGTAYYIMENIDGGSVDALVKNGGMKESDALKIIQEVGSALEYIHKQNVLHLDVKPSNILIRNNGEAVLIDFGISKRYDDAGGQTSTTPTGISKGYAPIEQYNQGLQNFSPATDVYSLGATLFKLLTGQTPPEAPMLLDEEEFPDCPSNVSTSIWSAIEKAMEPRKKKRYQGVNEFVSALTTNSIANNPKVEIPKQEETVVIPSAPSYSVKPFVSEETVVMKTNFINNNGHEYVDLGLSVKWAKYNVGANTEFEVGFLYPFAEYGDIASLPSSICGNVEYDNCHKAWGGNWRMPSKEEQDELRQKCTWEYIDSKNCYKVIGPNGQFIYLPTTETKSSFGRNWRIGCYWSGNLHVSNKQTAYYLIMDKSKNMISWMNDSLTKEFAIRGVIE
ncbi:MAG: serine/threonine protein kinase [Prevotellaceae bacterium]|nr:serine/threonine protein kinase [Candidatus Minthosoma equi]